MYKDIFEKVPEFLASFNHTQQNGFFELVKFEAGSPMMEGKIYSLQFTAIGCVPNDKKYCSEGCGTVIDPNAIVASCRKLADQKEVKDVKTEVATDNWLLFDANGEKVIGSKGTRTKLALYITFEF